MLNPEPIITEYKAHLRSQIKEYMERVHQETGAFKYDWCFEAVLDMLEDNQSENDLG